MQLIQFTEMMKIMRKVDSNKEPIPFSLKVVKYDVKRNSGGDFLIVEKGVIDKQKDKSKTSSAFSKKPNHYENSTLNIMILPSNVCRKIHPRLIIEFNNKKVFY